MNRLRWIVCGAACLFALALWLFLKSAPSELETSADETAPLSEPPNRSSQTPTAAPETDYAIIQEEDSIEIAVPDAAPSGDPPDLAPLASVDETLDEYARLVGERYDLLIQTMDPHEAVMYSRHQIHLELREGKHPRLMEGLRQFQGKFPPESQSPSSLLARAGRIPNENIWTLPNGDEIEIKPNTEVVVTFYKRGSLTSEGLRKLEAAEKEEWDILERLETAGVSEEERVSLEEGLEAARLLQKNLLEREPGAFEITRIHGDKNHPDFKTININLGVVD